MRPGRFDRQVTVDRPDYAGRLQILNVHAKDKTLSKDVDLDKVARRTPGFTGADLANLLNEAAILAARKDLDKVSSPCWPSRNRKNITSKSSSWRSRCTFFLNIGFRICRNVCRGWSFQSQGSF